MSARVISGISILFAVQCFAFSTNDYKLERVPIGQKLTQTTINCIYQDHLGYLWIGTLGGLNRYDGHELITYNHNPQDTTSPPHDNITDILEDNIGRLYIAGKGGLALFNRNTNTFSTLLSQPHRLYKNRFIFFVGVFSNSSG